MSVADSRPWSLNITPCGTANPSISCCRWLCRRKPVDITAKYLCHVHTTFRQCSLQNPFSALKIGYLVIFDFFFVLGRKWIFIFVFVPKMSFALGWECSVLNWTLSKFCDIGTGDFRFCFSAENGIQFRRHFHLRPKMKNAFSVGIQFTQYNPACKAFVQTFQHCFVGLSTARKYKIPGFSRVK